MTLTQTNYISYQLHEETDELIKKLQIKGSLARGSKTGVINWAIREAARKEGVL